MKQTVYIGALIYPDGETEAIVADLSEEYTRQVLGARLHRADTEMRTIAGHVFKIELDLNTMTDQGRRRISPTWDDFWQMMKVQADG